MSTLPDWENAFKRQYCSQCGADVTFDDGECEDCTGGSDYVDTVLGT